LHTGRAYEYSRALHKDRFRATIGHRCNARKDFSKRPAELPKSPYTSFEIEAL
jgi:hypothetical protein